MQVLGKPGRGGGDGHRPFADGGFAPHPLGGAVGGLQEGLEAASGHARVAGHAVAGLDLAQDLRLADDQAVERRRHGKDVADGVLAAQDIGLVLQFRHIDAAVPGHDLDNPFGGGVRVFMEGLDLDPVAGAENHRRLETGFPEPFQELGRLGVLDEQPVAQAQGGGAVIGADDERRQGWGFRCSHDGTGYR